MELVWDKINERYVEEPTIVFTFRPGYMRFEPNCSECYRPKYVGIEGINPVCRCEGKNW